MSYMIERDWVTVAGLRAVVVRLKDSLGHRCGYVGLPKTHLLHGVGYSQNTSFLRFPEDEPYGKRGVFTALLGHERLTSPEVVFDVHGSLTYADSCPTYPAANDGLWWFGFDAAHCDDHEEGGRSLEYMVNECESLARQINTKTVAEIAP